QVESKGVSQAIFGMLPPFRQGKLNADTVIESFRAHFIVRLNELTRERPGFSLSKEEQEQAFSIAKAFLDDLNSEVITLVLSIIGKSQFDDKDFQLPIEDALGKIATEIILGTAKDGEYDGYDEGLPQFRYDLKTRDLDRKSVV